LIPLASISRPCCFPLPQICSSSRDSLPTLSGSSLTSNLWLFQSIWADRNFTAYTPLENPINIADIYQQAMVTGTKVDNQDMSKLTAHDTMQNPDKDLENHNGTQSDDSFIDPNFQLGVQDIEAVPISWTFFALVVAYVMIWFVYFVQGLVSGISGTLLPYVTSAFAEHSLTPTTSVIIAVIGGVTNLSIAKVLDIFSRPQGYLLCIVFTTIGLVMSAA
jgi:hypothetical protein